MGISVRTLSEKATAAAAATIAITAISEEATATAAAVPCCAAVSEETATTAASANSSTARTAVAAAASAARILAVTAVASSAAVAASASTAAGAGSVWNAAGARIYSAGQFAAKEKINHTKVCQRSGCASFLFLASVSTISTASTNFPFGTAAIVPSASATASSISSAVAARTCGSVAVASAAASAVGATGSSIAAGISRTVSIAAAASTGTTSAAMSFLGSTVSSTFTALCCDISAETCGATRFPSGGGRCTLAATSSANYVNFCSLGKFNVYDFNVAATTTAAAGRVFTRTICSATAAANSENLKSLVYRRGSFPCHTFGDFLYNEVVNISPVNF